MSLLSVCRCWQNHTHGRNCRPEDCWPHHGRHLGQWIAKAAVNMGQAGRLCGADGEWLWMVCVQVKCVDCAEHASPSCLYSSRHQLTPGCVRSCGLLMLMVQSANGCVVVVLLQDIHSSNTTVEEALWFSGRLRLPPSVTDAQVRCRRCEPICSVAFGFCSISLSLSSATIALPCTQCAVHSTERSCCADFAGVMLVPPYRCAHVLTRCLPRWI